MHRHHTHHHRGLEPRHAIELQLQSWKPFTPKPYKRPCLSDRTTSSFSIIDTASLDISRLSLFDDDRQISSSHTQQRGNSSSLPWIHRKRRRRGSRSVSGRSSDRSGTRRRCCSVGASAAYGTCSDFPVAVGTDSSGELFLNGDGNWGSDVSEASKNNTRKERESGGSGDKESLSSSGFIQLGSFENQGNESGYGSEPGYRGDAELGYGDEVDTEEDDHRLSLWGEKFQGTDTNMEMAGESTLQKAHHRGRRKKHDVRTVDPLR